MFYGGDAGSPINPMAGAGRLAAMMMARRRRKPGFRVAGPIPGLPADGGVDPGFNMQPDPSYQVDQGINLGGAGSMLRKRMLEGGPGVQPIEGGRVRWGGKIFTDPNKLWGWEQKHGNTGGADRFWRLHPDAARRLGMPVDEGFDQANPLDPAQLKAGLIGQLSQVHGALEGTPIAGVQHRVAANMMGQKRRMHAVGAAQGRAQALAAVMARRLRGRQM